MINFYLFYKDKEAGKNEMFFQNNRLCLTVLSVFLLFNATAGHASQVQPAKSPSSKTLRSMARVYMAYGEYKKAEPLARKALQAAKKQEDNNVELAMCMIDLATLCRFQGKLREARSVCEKGLKLQEDALFKNHPYVAYTLRNLACIHQAQGENEKAKEMLERAVEIMLESHSENDKALAPFWVDVAKVLTEQGDFEQAQGYYERAISLIEESYGPEHLYTAMVNGSMAELFVLQGKYPEADELVNQAIAIQEKYYGPGHHLTAPLWLTKAELYLVRGDYASAEALIAEALEVIRKAENHPALADLEERAERIRDQLQPVAKVQAQKLDS